MLNSLLKKIVLFIARTALEIVYPVRFPRTVDAPLEPLIKELKNSFRDLKLEDPNNSEVPSERAWLNVSQALKKKVESDDLRRFLRWDIIIETMCSTFMPYLNVKLNFLKGLKDWETRWKKALLEKSSVGAPFPFWGYSKTSGNLIHIAHLLAKFENMARKRTNDLDLILEFGGGYGCMCRLAYNAGFSGKYIIFDLPLFLLLQKFYLKAHHMKLLTVENFNNETSGVLLIDNLDFLGKLISKNQEMKNSLFIATWSLSEISLSLRERIFQLVHRFGNHLIAYQFVFHEIDNVEYFKTWARNQPEKKWDTSFLKYFGKNAHLIGYLEKFP